MVKRPFWLAGLVLAAWGGAALAVPPYEPLPSSSRKQVEEKPASNAGLDYPRAVAESAPSAAQAGAQSWETYSQMQQLQEELQSLRGMVEELNHQLKVMQQQERDRYIDLDSRINALSGGAGGTGGAGVNPNLPKVELPQDDKEAYQLASEMRRKGDYAEAIATLEALLARNPKGAYAPYSQYWLGELYMVAEPIDLEAAKRNFIGLLGSDPDHVKVPDAMYKLGKLYIQQGEKEKARSVLNQLVKQFPGKSAARLGQDQLNRL